MVSSIPCLTILLSDVSIKVVINSIFRIFFFHRKWFTPSIWMVSQKIPKPEEPIVQLIMTRKKHADEDAYW